MLIPEMFSTGSLFVFFDRKIPRNTPVMIAKATEY